MKKLFLLAAVALSLFLLGYGVLWPGSSAAMPMPQVTPVVTEIPPPIPTLTLDKGMVEKPVTDLDGDGKVDPGDTIRYTISYSNTGQITATNVILVDDYNETLIESVANITGEGGKDNGKTITWELGTLASGKGGSVTYEATLKGTFPPGSVNMENSATIDSDETDPVSATSLVRMKGPNLTIRKGRAETIVQDLGVAGVIDAGDTIKYVITYENIGDAEATNAVIVDDYDQDSIANMANISPEGVNDGETITWALGTVEAGGKGQVTYEAKLKDTFRRPTDVKNQVTISSDGVAPVKVEAIVRVEVAPTPTPEPTPVPPAEGPTAGIFATWQWLPAALVLVLGAGGIAGLIFAGLRIPISEGDGNERILVILEGITVNLIICAVIMLALGLGIKSEAAASIISAVAGYVFGRARARISR